VTPPRDTKSNRGRRIVVIGVGNEYRGDDAVGRIVARRLSGVLAGDVDVIESEGGATHLMDAFAGASVAFIVDAVRSGADPGHIHRLDGAIPLPAQLFGMSTHGFGVTEAVELARTLGSLPETLIVYGIESAGFNAGTEVSDPVAGAVDTVIERILRDVDELTRPS
jgi:hydrogenase maturation protease